MLLHQHVSARAPDNERFCGVGLWQTPGDQRGILVCGLSSGAGTFTLHAVVLTCPRQMDRPLLTPLSPHCPQSLWVWKRAGVSSSSGAWQPAGLGEIVVTQEHPVRS